MKSIVLIFACLSCFMAYSAERAAVTVIDGIAIPHDLILEATDAYLWERRGIGRPVEVELIWPAFMDFDSVGSDRQRLEVTVRVNRHVGLHTAYTCLLNGSFGENGSREVDVETCRMGHLINSMPSMWD